MGRPRAAPYDEQSSPCFCDAGDAVAGAVFEEEHQGQGDGEGADEEVQGDGITIGIFFDERQDQGPATPAAPQAVRMRPWMALRYFVPKRSLR